MPEENKGKIMNKKNMRFSHPNLFRGILSMALISISLGFNFIFTNPTFNPYHIPKALTGSIFLTLGISRLIFLIIIPHLKILRGVMSIGIAWKVFWGIGTSITFFQGLTSLQLFVLYMGLSFLELFFLIEPSVNPYSQRKEKS